MSSPTDSPTDRARSLAPLIRQHASEAQKERRLPTTVVDALHDAGLFRMCLPREFAGEEVDPWTTVETIEAISYGDGSTGWNFMIGSETNGLAAASLPEQMAKEIFGGTPAPKIIFCGAQGPPGTAEKVEGGWRVNGQWGFVSGCHQGTWFFGTALVMKGGQPEITEQGLPHIRMFLMTFDQVEILDTWDVAGMRGSGSHDVAARDLFVSNEDAESMLGNPTWHPSPIFHFPMQAKLAYNKVACSFGVARAAIDEFRTLSETKKAFGTMTPIRELPNTQIQVAEAEARLGSARAYLRETLEQVWELVQAGDVPTPQQLAPLRLACSYGTQASIDAVDRLLRLTGTTGNRKDNLLERFYRDVRAVPGHFTLSPNLYEPIGKSLLGFELPEGTL